jgi:hypothetical protein
MINPLQQPGIYEYLGDRLTAHHPDGRAGKRMSIIKLAGFFAASGNEPLRLKIVDACMNAKLLETKTSIFLLRLQRIIDEATGQATSPKDPQ